MYVFERVERERDREKTLTLERHMGWLSRQDTEVETAETQKSSENAISKKEDSEDELNLT